jgi:uncharacterized protein (UPF0335 family)
MPSFQLQKYLQLRADGYTVEDASEQSGIGLAEARLHEIDIESGELELPSARTRAPAREGEHPKEETSMSNGNIAADELRLLIERIERLHEERQGIADDIKDVFQEAKSQGFDTKAMKQVMKLRKMEPHVRQEAEALLGTYLSALGMTPIEEAISLAAAA